MHTNLQTEALLCPNCKEEVPKTLYCLNCGYPLYKIEMDKSEVKDDQEVLEDKPVFEAKTIEEVTDEITKSITEEPVVEVKTIDELIDEPQEPIRDETVIEAPTIENSVDELPEPVKDVTISETPTIEDVVLMVEDAFAPPTDKDIEEESAEAEESIMVTDFIEENVTIVEPETEEIIPVDEAAAIVEVKEPTYEDVLDISIEESKESVEANVFEVVEGPEIEDVEMVEDEAPNADVLAELTSYEPAPVVREVMDNFAKNISLKIKLVNLLVDGGVKPEIFERLYESYLSHGELLSNSRNEMLERVKFDQHSMEKALDAAKKGLEELEIRRAINDVSEEEYSAKAPGFEWDINKYADEVGRKRTEIAFLEDITKVITAEQMDELVKTGNKCLETLDNLVESNKITNETSMMIRISLEEALSCLRS